MREETESTLDQRDSNDKLYLVLNRVGSREVLRESTPLAVALSLDSLKTLELVSHLEETFGVEVREDKLTPETTIAGLRELLKEKASVEANMRLKRSNFSIPITAVRFVLQLVLLPLLRIFCSMRVEGLKHVHGIDGPHLFAINHTSHLDTPIFIHAMPYKIRKKLAFAAAADVFYSEEIMDARGIKLIRNFLELLLNTFPFSRTASFRQSIKNCTEVLDMGYHVCLYPEGTRSVDGRILDFKAGIGMLAHQRRVPIVPVRIDGLFSVLKKGSVIPRFGRVTIRIGEPYVASENQSYFDISQRVRTLVENL